MSVSYDRFTESFLCKVSELDFLELTEYERNHLIDGYMKRALSEFGNMSGYDLIGAADDTVREFDIEIPIAELEDILNVVSEGMVVQWLKPYTFKQENLESILNTRDYTTYSPAELLNKVSALHTATKKEFKNMMREYSYNHGNLADLHL